MLAASFCTAARLIRLNRDFRLVRFFRIGLIGRLIAQIPLCGRFVRAACQAVDVVAEINNAAVVGKRKPDVAFLYPSE